MRHGRVNRLRQGAFALIGVLLHFAGAVLVSMIVGVFPEGLVGERMYHGTVIEPFFPFVAGVAIVIGILVARWLRDAKAKWAWVPGLLWFGFVAYHDLLAGGRWGRLQYAFDNLLTTKCSGTECAYELICTAPLIASIAYSVASLITIEIVRRKKGIVERSRWTS